MSEISYAITVCNEGKELQKLLTLLTQYVRERDEIVVLVDLNKFTPEVESILKGYRQSVKECRGCFEGDFGAWKNKLTSFCTKDWIFQLDADEQVSEYLLKNLSQILDLNSDNVDLFYLPRINTVSGLTQEDVKKWHWSVGSDGRVNWPDYQGRLYKRSNIVWEGKVHERLTGFKQYTFFPQEDKFALIHPKDIERQRQQNSYYATIK